jgi:hypothetical protein
MALTDKELLQIRAIVHSELATMAENLSRVAPLFDLQTALDKEADRLNAQVRAFNLSLEGGNHGI